MLGAFSCSVWFPQLSQLNKAQNRHVMALASILRRWRLENASECDAFVTPRGSLHKLYDAVKRLETA